MKPKCPGCGADTDQLQYFSVENISCSPVCKVCKLKFSYRSDCKTYYTLSFSYVKELDIVYHYNSRIDITNFEMEEDYIRPNGHMDVRLKHQDLQGFVTLNKFLKLIKYL